MRSSFSGEDISCPSSRTTSTAPPYNRDHLRLSLSPSHIASSSQKVSSLPFCPGFSFELMLIPLRVISSAIASTPAPTRNDERYANSSITLLRLMYPGMYIPPVCMFLVSLPSLAVKLLYPSAVATGFCAPFWRFLRDMSRSGQFGPIIKRGIHRRVVNHHGVGEVRRFCTFRLFIHEDFTDGVFRPRRL